MAFDEAPYARRGRFVCLADATAAVEPAVEANAWAGEELVPALGPVEARGHFIGEPDGLDEEGTGWVKGVAAMAVAAGVGAQEAAVELDGVELLIGLKVGAGRHDAVRGRELEGRGPSQVILLPSSSLTYSLQGFSRDSGCRISLKISVTLFLSRF